MRFTVFSEIAIYCRCVGFSGLGILVRVGLIFWIFNVCSFSVGAEERGPRIQLLYRLPPDLVSHCPAKGELAAQIRDRLGVVLVEEGQDTALDVAVERLDGSFRVRFRFVKVGGTQGDPEPFATFPTSGIFGQNPDCGDLLRRFSLYLHSLLPVRPSGSEANRPGPAAIPRVLAEGRTGTEPPSPVETHPCSVTCSACPQAETSGGSEAKAGALTSSVAASGPPACPCPDRSPSLSPEPLGPWWFLVGIGLGMGLGLSPGSVDGRLGALAALRPHPRFSVGLGVDAHLPSAETVEQVMGQAPNLLLVRGQVLGQLTRGSLTPCFHLEGPGQSNEILACGLLSAGAMDLDGRNVPGAMSDHAEYLALGARLSLDLGFRSLVLRSSLDLLVPVLRPSAVARDSMGRTDEVFWTLPPVGAVVSVEAMIPWRSPTGKRGRR